MQSKEAKRIEAAEWRGKARAFRAAVQMVKSDAVQMGMNVRETFETAARASDAEADRMTKEANR